MVYLVVFPEELTSYIDSIANSESPSGSFEIDVLSHLTDVDVRIVKEKFLLPNSVNHLENQSTRSIVYLSLVDGEYKCFIDSERLTSAMCRRLFPLLAIKRATTSNEADLTVFKKAKAKLMLVNMLTVVPSHMTDISKHVGDRPDFDERTFLPNPLNSKLRLRFNSQVESSLMLKNMEKVQTTNGYSLRLLRPGGCKDKGVIYVELGETEFNYHILGETINRHMGVIEYASLNSKFVYPVTIEKLKPHLRKILQITKQRGHTLVEPVKIGGIRSWGPSMSDILKNYKE